MSFPAISERHHISGAAAGVIAFDLLIGVEIDAVDPDFRENELPRNPFAASPVSDRSVSVNPAAVISDTATTAASLNTGGTSLSGVFSGESVSLSMAGAVGTFVTAAVGNSINVIVSGLTIIC